MQNRVPTMAGADEGFLVLRFRVSGWDWGVWVLGLGFGIELSGLRFWVWG